MMGHYQRMHGEERPFRCDVCNKSFDFEQDLMQHKIIHTEE